MSSILRAGLLILAVHLVARSAGTLFAATGVAPPDTLQTVSPPVTSPPSSLVFEVNRGQAASSVKFMARGPGFSLFLTSSEGHLVLQHDATEADVVRLHLKGSNSHPQVEGLGLLPGKSNYFIGNDPQKWRTGVAQFSKVVYRSVYPGIDMVYEGEGASLEYSFVVAPGANPNVILMDFIGAQRLRLDAQGHLILGFEKSEAAFKAPYLFQQIGIQRIPVEGHFVLTQDHLVRFEVGAYDHRQPLIIDPTLLYSTYLGGTVADRATAVAVDAAGNTYVAGYTTSNLFPGTAGHFQSANGGGASDVFVTKINPAGTAIVWSTYLGGAGDDEPNGIAVDASGNVYLTGSTTAGGFPMAAPFQAVNAGGTDAFLSAINAGGTALIYSTYLGGAGEDGAQGIAVSASGTAYVTGHTTSGDFPVSVGAFQLLHGGADDAFVASFNAAGLRQYASFLGGTTADHGNGIAIDSLGNAYITGQTSNGTFPITPLAPPTAEAFKLTITGSHDAFISKVNPLGTVLMYSTFVGGSVIDEATAIALDSANNVYITGHTYSADFPKIGFATVGQTTIGVAAPDAFVFKLHIGNGGGSNDGVYSTYLGASTDDRGTAIAVDGYGNAYVTGHTTSGDFPTVNPLPGQTVLAATGKVFITEINSTGAAQIFSTYLGGGTDQSGLGIALDSANNIYVVGWTNSANFDTMIPIQPANAGSFDGFSSKISAPTPAPSSPIALTGTALGISSISWTWNAVTDATLYSIYLATSPTTLVVSTPTTTYIETGLSSNTAYGRVITATVNGLESPLSEAATAYTLAATPGVPVFSAVFSTSFTMTWATNNPAGTRFEVSRSTTNDNFVTSVSTPLIFTGNFILGTTNFADLRPGTTYYLRVRAENGAVAGAGIPTAFSSAAIVTQATSVPLALSGTALGISSISWTWAAVPLASSYNVYQATSPSTLVANVVVAGFVETGLSSNTAYGRRVSAIVSGVESALSSAATAYTLAATPGISVFTNVFSTSFTVTWATNNPAGTRFEISRSTTNDGFTTAVSTPIAFTNNVTLGPIDMSGLLPNTTYYLRIRAENGNVAGGGIATAFSALGSTATASAPVGAPVLSLSPITGTDAGGTEVILTGSSFTGATRVTFDGHDAMSYTVDSATQITVRSPAQTAGPAINVVVTRLVGGDVTIGTYTYFAIAAITFIEPGTYIYPSPVNGPTATIVYGMEENGTVEIRVYNEIGDLAIRVNDSHSMGNQTSTIHTDRLAPGVYFYIVQLTYDSGNSKKLKPKKFVVNH